MEATPHVLLVSDGAKKFAQEQNIKIVPPGSLITPKTLEDLNQFKKEGREFHGPSIKVEHFLIWSNI